MIRRLLVRILTRLIQILMAIAGISDEDFIEPEETLLDEISAPIFYIADPDNHAYMAILPEMAASMIQTIPDICAEARGRGMETIRVQCQIKTTWDIYTAEILVSRLEDWMADLDAKPIDGLQYDIAAANERTQQ